MSLPVLCRREMDLKGKLPWFASLSQMGEIHESLTAFPKPMWLCGLTFVEWIFGTQIPQILLIQRLPKLHPDKAVFNLHVLRQVCSGSRVDKLFWKVSRCFHWKGFLLMSLPGERLRGSFNRWSSTGTDFYQPDSPAGRCD